MDILIIFVKNYVYEFDSKKNDKYCCSFNTIYYMRLGTGINIYQYCDASEVAKWIEFTFNVKDVYDILLRQDYIEGSLGSRYQLEELDPALYNDEDMQVSKWMNAFLIEFDLDDIQLKYG